MNENAGGLGSASLQTFHAPPAYLQAKPRKEVITPPRLSKIARRITRVLGRRRSTFYRFNQSNQTAFPCPGSADTNNRPPLP